jgi:hypothetical protein
VKNRIFIGYDQKMPLAYAVANRSLVEKSTLAAEIEPLLLPQLSALGYYTRPTSIRSGNMFDNISEAPMSTDFAISRFLVPALSNFWGWSLFCDSDFMFMSDIKKIFEMKDPKYAVMCVKHNYNAQEGVKMQGQAQTAYPRKNWSSFMLFNNAHPANRFLSCANVNKYTGRDLHRFCWLPDDLIGSIDESWNWLEGHSSEEITPDAIHYTRGTPDMVGYESVKYADQWRAYALEFKGICK